MAFLVAFVFTPIMRMVAMHYGIIDQPDHLRKMHTAPVAYLGGVAVFLGWLCGLAVSQFLSSTASSRAGRRRTPIVKFSIVAGGAGHRRAGVVGRHAEASALG